MSWLRDDAEKGWHATNWRKKFLSANISRERNCQRGEYVDDVCSQEHEKFKMSTQPFFFNNIKDKKPHFKLEFFKVKSYLFRPFSKQWHYWDISITTSWTGENVVCLGHVDFSTILSGQREGKLDNRWFVLPGYLYVVSSSVWDGNSSSPCRFTRLISGRIWTWTEAVGWRWYVDVCQLGEVGVGVDKACRLARLEQPYLVNLFKLCLSLW